MMRGTQGALRSG